MTWNFLYDEGRAFLLIKKHVLVTGGLGFIGWNLVKKLLDEKYRVLILDAQSATGTKFESDYLKNERLTIVQGDMLDSTLCDELISKVDGVFHLAASNSVSESLKYPDKYLKDNVIGTLNLLEACRKNGIEFFIFSSSCAVYGEQEKMPISETATLYPKSPYAVGKQMSECLCKLYSDVFLIPAVSLRYFNVFGPGQSDESEYSGVIAKFIKKIKNRESLTIYGDGSQTRDFVYVDNVVNANVNVSLEIDRVSGKVINLGTGVSVSIKELAEQLLGVFGVDVDIVYEESRQGEIESSLADVSMFLGSFNGQEIVTCEKGLSHWLNLTD